MREIKFRIWSPYRKVFVKGVAQREALFQKCSENSIWLDQDSVFIYQQFTGLKDKNSVEIYEGDILLIANTRAYEVRFITEERYSEVTCGFGLKSPELDYAFIIDTFAVKRGTVIGNIYENPELLETKNES